MSSAGSAAERVDVSYAAVFDATPSPLLVLTPELVIRAVNAAYLRAVGRSRAQLLGRQIFDVLPPHPGGAARDVRASMKRALDSGRADTMAVQRYDIAVGDGRVEERHWSVIHVPVLDEQGRALLLQRAEDVTDFMRARGADSAGAEGVSQRRMQDVEADLVTRAHELQALNAELRANHDELASRALQDPLTGLLVRPVILDQISRALSRAARQARPVAVLFVDLDRLKHVNDVYGHAAGDDLLRCFADQLRSCVRPGDGLARMGGDEFVILLEDLADAAGAASVADRILTGARSCQLRPGRSAELSASIGVVIAGSCPLAAETLVAQADRAMYRAKKAGGNRYEIALAGL